MDISIDCIILFLADSWFFQYLNEIALDIPNLFFQGFYLFRAILVMFKWFVQLVEFLFRQEQGDDFMEDEHNNDDKDGEVKGEEE